MTVTAENPTATLDAERIDLLAQLAEARASLVGPLQGLTDAQLGEQPTASALCLGGLVKHVASVEESLMLFVTGGPSAMGFDLPDGTTWQDLFTGAAQRPQWMVEHEQRFRMQPGDTRDAILEHYRQVAARTEQIVAAEPDLGRTQPLPDVPWYTPGEQRSVRRTLVRLIQEIAQHAGHADILRESIDGHVAG